jgi:hypothetical protein
LVFLDFSENYTLKIQNAVQSYYWNQKQATVHVVVALYKQDGKILTKNYVSLSGYLKHDTAAVHLYMSKVIAHMKTDLPFTIHKIFYFSDGCGGQYKNRVQNISQLLTDGELSNLEFLEVAHTGIRSNSEPVEKYSVKF